MTYAPAANALHLSEDGAASLAIAVRDGIRRAHKDRARMLDMADAADIRAVRFEQNGDTVAATRNVASAGDWRTRAVVAEGHAETLEGILETLATIPGGDADRL